MQENSLFSLEKQDYLESKINKYEHEIIQLKEKNQQISIRLKELNDQKQAEELKNAEQELESQKLNELFKQNEIELKRLQQSNKTQNLELECFQNILFQHASTQLEKEQIIDNQKNHYRDIYQKYVDLDIEIENLRKENLFLKNDKQLLQQSIENYQKSCKDIQETYNNRLKEFQEQFNNMNNTISILQKQVDEKKYFEDFIQQQIEINQKIELNIQETAPSYLTNPNNYTFNQQNQNISNNQQFSMIAEDIQTIDQEQYKMLEEENSQLNQQIVDYETKIAPKILLKEQEVKTLQEQLKELQKLNEVMAQENNLTNKELKELKEKQKMIKDNEQLSNMPIEQFTEKDILQLQKAYADEISTRMSIQQNLKTLQDEIKYKNPILRRQNEKWLLLNQEFLKFEQDYAQMQIDLKSKSQNIEELKSELKDSLNESIQLKSQVNFLTEEISRLASQIQHLLKVNMKLKQQISVRLGKNTLDEIINEIRKEKNAQYTIQDVDSVYQTNYSSIYSDIQEIVEMNMSLCKKLRDRS